MKASDIFKLVAAIAVSELAGIVGSLFTVSAIPTWYAGLAKPVLNPPSWIFAPVWTTLYLLMGIAAFLVWRTATASAAHAARTVSARATQTAPEAARQPYPHHRRNVRIALGIFIAQLILNALWSIVFFGLHNPAWALVVIVTLWFMIVWTMAAFAKISRAAMYLLVPYLAWVSFAAYLNFAIWVRN